MSTLLTPEIGRLVGTERVYTAPEEMGRASLRYFAMAIGDDNPLYTDPTRAREAGYDDVIAPPTFVCETNQYMTGTPDPNGYLGHSWEIEIENTRLIRGGHDYRFHHPLYPTDRLTVRWRITEVEEKTAPSGKAMLILTSEARYENQEGTLIADNRETLIFQER
jgi:acyl dehydratase